MAVRLEMVSDLVCPWCWLGLRRLRKAVVSLAGEIEVDVRFRPFQLDPTVPPDGVTYREYMTSKFGGTGDSGDADARKDQFARMREALETYGAEEGIPFRFSGIEMRPNTTDAHRLVRWAQGQGLGWDAKERLFKAYFEDHEDIGNRTVLVRLAGEIGLETEIVDGLYARGADVETTAREEQYFRSLGIGGVPTYITDRKFAVQGAESPEKIAKLIRAAEMAAPEERGVL